MRPCVHLRRYEGHTVLKDEIGYSQPITGLVCAWGQEHGFKLTGAPRWLQEAALRGAASLPQACEDCPAYAASKSDEPPLA